MKAIKLFSLFALMVLLSVACSKKAEDLTTEDLNLADDEVVSEAMFDDIFASADQVVQMLDYAGKGLETKGDALVVLADSCPLVTVDLSDQLVKTITIDYGDGCAGANELVRSGKIIIVVSGPRRETGSSRTLTFDNFYFNGIKIEGTKVVENMGPNENENVVFKASLEGGKMIFPNDTVVEREFVRYHEWIAGWDTRIIWDDECLITGDASGKNYRGHTYSNNIITALHWKRACRFIVSGLVEITRDDTDTILLDYGDGECDAKAVISRGDQEKEIILRIWHRKLR